MPAFCMSDFANLVNAAFDGPRWGAPTTVNNLSSAQQLGFNLKSASPPKSGYVQSVLIPPPAFVSVSRNSRFQRPLMTASMSTVELGSTCLGLRPSPDSSPQNKKPLALFSKIKQQLSRSSPKNRESGDYPHDPFLPIPHTVTFASEPEFRSVTSLDTTEGDDASSLHQPDISQDQHFGGAASLESASILSSPSKYSCPSFIGSSASFFEEGGAPQPGVDRDPYLISLGSTTTLPSADTHSVNPSVLSSSLSILSEESDYIPYLPLIIQHERLQKKLPMPMPMTLEPVDEHDGELFLTAGRRLQHTNSFTSFMSLASSRPSRQEEPPSPASSAETRGPVTPCTPFEQHMPPNRFRTFSEEKDKSRTRNQPKIRTRGRPTSSSPSTSTSPFTSPVTSPCTSPSPPRLARSKSNIQPERERERLSPPHSPPPKRPLPRPPANPESTAVDKSTSYESPSYLSSSSFSSSSSPSGRKRNRRKVVSDQFLTPAAIPDRNSHLTLAPRRSTEFPRHRHSSPLLSGGVINTPSPVRNVGGWDDHVQDDVGADSMSDLDIYATSADDAEPERKVGPVRKIGVGRQQVYSMPSVVDGLPHAAFGTQRHSAHLTPEAPAEAEQRRTGLEWTLRLGENHDSGSPATPTNNSNNNTTTATTTSTKTQQKRSSDQLKLVTPTSPPPAEAVIHPSLAPTPISRIRTKSESALRSMTDIARSPSTGNKNTTRGSSQARKHNSDGEGYGNVINQDWTLSLPLPTERDWERARRVSEIGMKKAGDGDGDARRKESKNRGEREKRARSESKGRDERVKEKVKERERQVGENGKRKRERERESPVVIRVEDVDAVFRREVELDIEHVDEDVRDGTVVEDEVVQLAAEGDLQVAMAIESWEVEELEEHSSRSSRVEENLAKLAALDEDLAKFNALLKDAAAVAASSSPRKGKRGATIKHAKSSGFNDSPDRLAVPAFDSPSKKPKREVVSREEEDDDGGMYPFSNMASPSPENAILRMPSVELFFEEVESRRTRARSSVTTTSTMPSFIDVGSPKSQGPTLIPPSPTPAQSVPVSSVVPESVSASLPPSFSRVPNPIDPTSSFIDMEVSEPPSPVPIPPSTEPANVVPASSSPVAPDFVSASLPSSPRTSSSFSRTSSSLGSSSSIGRGNSPGRHNKIRGPLPFAPTPSAGFAGGRLSHPPSSFALGTAAGTAPTLSSVPSTSTMGFNVGLGRPGVGRPLSCSSSLSRMSSSSTTSFKSSSSGHGNGLRVATGVVTIPPTYPPAAPPAKVDTERGSPTSTSSSPAQTPTRTSPCPQTTVTTTSPHRRASYASTSDSLTPIASSYDDSSPLPTPLASSFPVPPPFPLIIEGLIEGTVPRLGSSPTTSSTHVSLYHPPSTASSVSSAKTSSSGATVVPAGSMEERVRLRMRELRGGDFGDEGAGAGELLTVPSVVSKYAPGTGLMCEEEVEVEVEPELDGDSMCSGTYYSARSSFSEFR